LRQRASRCGWLPKGTWVGHQARAGFCEASIGLFLSGDTGITVQRCSGDTFSRIVTHA
jgi:hypothetical protein